MLSWGDIAKLGVLLLMFLIFAWFLAGGGEDEGGEE